MSGGRHRAARSHGGTWIVSAIVFVLLGVGGFVVYRAATKGNAAAAGAATASSGASLASSPTLASPSVTTSVSGSPTASPAMRSVTISAVGDTMLGYAGHYPPDPGQYLDHVHGQMQANIEFGNLEGALSNGSQSKCGKNSTNCVAFVEPTSYATYLDDNGFTVLNSANNHSLDAGWGGLTETTSALHAAHIAQTGLNGQMAIVTSNGVKVAFIGFAPYPGITNSLLDYATAASLIQQAKKKADFVVVYMHAGAEGTNAMHVTGGYEYFDGENRGNPETFAHMAVNAGADLVIASGPHVLRGMEFYRGHLIAYSLGDFAGYGNFGLGGVLSDSAILKVTMAADGTLISARVYPVRLEGLGQPYPDPTGTSLRLISTLSKQDFGASAAVIRADGTVVIPKGSGGG